ncbi:MAG: ribonuclease HII [Coriobacteriaceae bacterium]|nr:ribonuclease HII [Coriobacteriaceae bacterium]
MAELSDGGLAVGLDEVGRGALAGPLTVAAVCLPDEPQIVGLDDSKKLTPKRREEIAGQVRESALDISLAHVPADVIDRIGMAAALRRAFTQALDGITESVDAVLIDGQALHVHPLERNIVKGDGKVACIAAASIIAKVTRDALMRDYAEEYPDYGFDQNKGYASAEHMQVIRELGPCPLHRRSFLGNILSKEDSLL